MLTRSLKERCAAVASALSPDLELPLRGHDLRVGAADVDPGVEGGAVVGLQHVAPVHLEEKEEEEEEEEEEEDQEKKHQ